MATTPVPSPWALPAVQRAKRGEEVAHAAPSGDRAGVLAVGFAGVTQGPSQAGLPGGQYRRLVLVFRDQGQVGVWPQVAEVVAADAAENRASGRWLIETMPPVGRTPVGSSMKALRATTHVSCAKSRGNSWATSVNMHCPRPRRAMSFSSSASLSFSVPSPTTLTVIPAFAQGSTIVS